jgi:hypothetical protein
MRVGGDNSDSKEESSWQGGVWAGGYFFQITECLSGSTLQIIQIIANPPYLYFIFCPRDCIVAPNIKCLGSHYISMFIDSHFTYLL